MTRKELRRWLERHGCLHTIRGKKYIQVHRMEDHASLGFWETAVAWFWGRNDGTITFTLHDQKPAIWKKQKSDSYEVKLHADGSQTVVNGDVSYFVPPGRKLPELEMTEITAPLQSFRSLESNIQLLTQFVNECIKANKF